MCKRERRVIWGDEDERKRRNDCGRKRKEKKGG
jgi:hypothetical protein